MRAMLGAALLFAVALAGAQAQQLYRWVDKDGKVHYTQQAPPSDAKNVQRRAGPAAAPDSADEIAIQLAAKNRPVSLFTTLDCGSWCKEAREYLNGRGVPFDEVVVDDDKSMEDLKRLTGKTQVPVLRVAARVEVGYDSETWKAALDAAGYPATGARVRGQTKGVTGPAGPLPPVKLYTSAECGRLCDQARGVLTARGVKFEEVEVSYSVPETVDDLQKVSGDTKLPVLVVGQRVQRGFEAVLYQAALDAAGFPAAGPASGAAPAKK